MTESGIRLSELYRTEKVDRHQPVSFKQGFSSVTLSLTVLGVLYKNDLEVPVQVTANSENPEQHELRSFVQNILVSLVSGKRVSLSLSFRLIHSR